jgi:signal transduction histidine kinase
MALENFRKAEKLLKDHQDPLIKAQNIFDIAECYRHMEDYEKAYALHQKALEIRKSENDITGLAESYIKLGKLMLDQKKYDQAEQFEMKGLTYAMQLNSNYLMRECYDNLYYIYSGTGNMKGARYFKDLFAYISEMIYTEADKHKLGELQSLLDISEKDRELKTLDAKIQRQHTYIAFGIALAIVFGLVATIIYFFYKEKKQLVRQLQETNAQVKRQIEELKELNSTKDKFFSIIGHDLKGPLNSLTAFSNLILHHASTLSEEEMKKIAADLNKSLKILYELLENLLTWARSQTNRLTLQPEKLDIRQLIEDNISLLSKTAKNKEIRIEHIAFENVTAWADKNTVNTVIRNLLSNALKFTPRGGSVTIFANAYKDGVEIGIRDTGVGMSPEQIKKVFDISTKHSTPGTEQEKGTGLGLILCREFVEKNGGQLHIESVEGKGSTFRFTLPANAPGHTGPKAV